MGSPAPPPSLSGEQTGIVASARRALPGVLGLAAGAVLVVVAAVASYWLVRDQPARSSITPHAVEDVTPAAAAGARPSTDDARPPLGEVGATGTTGVTGVAAAAPLPLGVAAGAFSPAFATSGRELVFHEGRQDAGRLLVASLDGDGQVARVRALVDDRARNYHPRVSPDGQLLAFDSDRDGERRVYVSERDGSDPQPMSGAGYGAVPSWSPDMKWLAFVRGEPTRPRVWNLWLRDLSSGALQRHTSFRSGQVWGASWFPDGQALCYTHETSLVISHLDGRDDIVIDTPRRGRLVRTPAVSPDGRRVVFQVFKDGAWLLDVRTHRMERLLDDPSAEEFAWAPDGRRIAYHSRRDGRWRIWLMQVPQCRRCEDATLEDPP